MTPDRDAATRPEPPPEPPMPSPSRPRTSAEGLGEAEAAARLAEFGPNALPARRGRGVVDIAIETVREPMFLLLLAATALYLVLGDLREGLFLAGAALASVGLVVLQESRSERALAALRQLAEPSARVIRGGVQRRVAARDLVPGDLMLIGEGERAPADGLLVGGEALRVDEAVLTGESAPVSKRPAVAGEDFGAGIAPGAEEGPFLFAGTMVTAGQGVVEVARTGAASALGRIGASLAEIEAEPTPLQRRAGRLVGLLGGAALAFCGVVIVVYGLVRHDWVSGVLAGITLAISLIPEEFPMVLAVFMALGAWRLANRRVLVRRSAVIEALGGATVLCVDKTGTLTENRMRVARLWRAGETAALEDEAAPPPAFAGLVEAAALASAVRPIDPMDRAVRALRPGDEGREPAKVWPLRPGRLAVTQAWAGADGGWRAAAKGAPEAVFGLCRLAPDERAAAQSAVEAMAAEGLRVLAAGAAEGAGEVPAEPEAIAFRFEGLIGFIDPVRADVPAAIEEAHAAGVKVVMITGDHPATALAIARAAGLDGAAGVVLGPEMAALDEAALRERLKTARIFARMVPDQKLRLVEALKAAGEVVAMTGDGVNDAPALEAAHIGIAMGEKGTDVARDAADLVLLDDSFASIVGGVRMGRRISANLRRALTFVVAIHVPIGGLALLPVAAGLPPLLFPMHVVLLELAIDPTCALVFEGERSDEDAMRRPPRPPDEPLFGPRQLLAGLVQGGLVLLLAFGLYLFALARYAEAEARGAAFLVLVASVLALALADAIGPRGRLFAKGRLAYWTIAGAVAAALAVIFAVPGIAAVFRVSALPAGLALLSLALPALVAAAVRLGLGRVRRA